VTTRTHAPRAAIARTANLPYGGGPVLHSNRTHVIFWQPSGSGLSFDPGYMSMVNTFLADVAADSRKPSNVYGLSGQYHDVAGPAAYNSTYGGSVVATDPLPPNGCIEPPVTGPGWSVCLTDGQLQDEINHVVAVDHLPVTEGNVYFLVTPNGFGSCTDSSSSVCALGGSPNGYCGYHAETAAQALYAFIPYNAVHGHCQSDNPRPNGSTADPTLSTLSHEHNELVTDPLGDAWVNGFSQEDGDLCVTSYGPALGSSGSGVWNEAIHGGHFYLQEEWSNDDNSCQPRDENDHVSFSGPRRGRTHQRLSFRASASDPDGGVVSYNWFFGSGRPGHGRVVKHSFPRAGTFRIVLRTTDSAGNWTYYARTIRIRKAPRRR
jgi:hypothetical protein